MTRTRSLAASLLSLSTAAILALAGAGSASAAPSTADKKSPQSVASATVDSTGAAEYWTADRMRAAIPGDVLAGKALERSSSSAASVLKGPKKTVQGTKGKPTLAQAANPVAHIGKVFFILGGANYVCSGNAVVSGNKSTVATAGHCVHEGHSGFATKFIFVPGYQDGAAPYGEWTSSTLHTPTQWSSGGDINYDTGFAVMNPRVDGALLEEVIGGASGVEFNADRGLPYTSFGYPAAKPFDGKTLKSCTGTASNDTVNPQFTTQGIPCDMTGGSSGGPWFIGSGPDGLQNSVNSYGYGPKPVMYGPAWGSVIEAAYDFAAAA